MNIIGDIYLVMIVTLTCMRMRIIQLCHVLQMKILLVLKVSKNSHIV